MTENNPLPDDSDVIRPRIFTPIPQGVDWPTNPTTPVEGTSVVMGVDIAVEEDNDIPLHSDAASEPVVNETDDEDDLRIDNNLADEGDGPSDDISYPEDKIDFRGEQSENLVELMRAAEAQLGGQTLDTRVRTVGTWENIMFRALMEPNFEEIRIQDALVQIEDAERKSMSSRYRHPDTGKTLLRTSSIIGQGPAPGETKQLSGEEAILAFENLGAKKGGGYRIPLYNSGITIDVIVPTGNDIQTMLTNCVIMDRQLGATSGAHYFTYADQMYKSQILNFLQPLIVNSSYADWRKKGKLWSVIKLPDLQAIVMNIAAICYKEGFDGFMTKCTRPVTEEHPTLCRHSETITANLFEMIVTRFAAMNKESIDFMVAARMGNNKTSLTQIAQYQADLGLEGERLTFGDVTFTMRIPTLTEHLDAGAKFLSDIVNEIEGDNTEGHYEQVAFRYIRSFLPWIGSVEKRGANGEVIKTSEPRVIVRELEKFDDKDPEDTLREAMRSYINKVQLTYVGYPVTDCPACGYAADTPSGMWTFDPFSAFFTLAFLYLRPST